MMNDKAKCVKIAKKYDFTIGMEAEELVMEVISISPVIGREWLNN